MKIDREWLEQALARVSGRLSLPNLCLSESLDFKPVPLHVVCFRAQGLGAYGSGGLKYPLPSTSTKMGFVKEEELFRNLQMHFRPTV